MSTERKPFLDFDTIDFNGPDGNSYYLMALWRQRAQEAGWTKAEIDQVLKEAKSSDYEHLVQTLKDNSRG
ncbi:hypothetical protein [Rufibacter ruber]|uniref:hypothetical protein n=1 Tax=Rufibacter ruber TaxID=1783499 RepID=UPI000829BEB9|nr:hypothetical protein [Rufibacter ruber]